MWVPKWLVVAWVVLAAFHAVRMYPNFKDGIREISYDAGLREKW